MRQTPGGSIVRLRLTPEVETRGGCIVLSEDTSLYQELGCKDEEGIELVSGQSEEER